MRGWERVTPTDLARFVDRGRRAQSAVNKLTKPHKYRAEPCIVAPDGTLFTTSDIVTAETARTIPPIGPLLERAAALGINGRWFASKKEGLRYLELTALERAGAISELRCQVEFDLTVVSDIDGQRRVVGRWTADFVYRREGWPVVEDTKSKATRTEAYQLRKKIFEAQYGMKILET